MKLAVITMKQCPVAASAKPKAYLGFRCTASYVEHLLESSKGPARIRRECRGCVLAGIVEGSYLVSTPIVFEDGRIRFIAVYNNAVRRLLQRHRDQLVSVEIVDSRSLLLTPRQRRLIALMAENPSPSRLASILGVTRPSASKAVRRVLRKLSLLHA